jgi:hypothetical protein
VSGVLARIKALFAPSREPAPPPVVDEPPISTIAVTEPEALADEPIAVVEVAAAPAPPAPAAEAAPPVEEAPAPPTVTAPPQAGGLTLRLETERGARSTFEVTKSGATIGRGPESTIQLADLSVSRKHAKITYKQGAYWLSDLGSMGGTWIDGAKLAAPRRVATGQTIDIGVCRLTVVSAETAEEASANGPTHAA